MDSLAAFAAEPAFALVACFFAGSAAGATSTLVVLALAWAALRHLRSAQSLHSLPPSPPLRSSHEPPRR